MSIIMIAAEQKYALIYKVTPTPAQNKKNTPEN